MPTTPPDPDVNPDVDPDADLRVRRMLCLFDHVFSGVEHDDGVCDRCDADRWRNLNPTFRRQVILLRKGRVGGLRGH